MHALVRGPESLLPRPFARYRALKGAKPDAAGHAEPNSSLFPCGGVCVATAPMRRWAKSRRT